MSLFYCPNCKEIEIDKITYNEKNIIYNNYRDGYGLILHCVICKVCGYPLATYVNIKNNNKDEIEYYKSVIESYQNGEYETKENMLKEIKKIHMENYNIVSTCNKFIL